LLKLFSTFFSCNVENIRYFASLNNCVE
jgi:hypothetical protein